MATPPFRIFLDRYSMGSFSPNLPRRNIAPFLELWEAVFSEMNCEGLDKGSHEIVAPE